MHIHSPSELRYQADILGPEGAVRASGISAGIQTLSGKRLEQSQLIARETTHQITFNYVDVTGVLDGSCYIVIDGVTYILDADPLDPRLPLPGMWYEALCHVINSGKVDGSTPVSPAQTFKAYVDTQDAATLAAAEAYAQTHPGPQGPQGPEGPPGPQGIQGPPSDWSSLAGIPSTFPPSPHTHVAAQITDFPQLALVATSGSYTDLLNKPTIPTPVWGGITGTLSSQTDLQSALNAKAPSVSPSLTGLVSVTPSAASVVGMEVKGVSGQTANLLNVTAYGGASGGLLSVAADGTTTITTGNSSGNVLNAVGTATLARINVNNTGGTNTGFSFLIGSGKKWTIASYQRNTGNFDFTFWNEQTGSDAFWIDGNTNDTTFNGKLTIGSGLLRIVGRTSTAADPTTTELPSDKDCGIHKNTTNGNVYLAYNDGGTIKKVQLT